MWNHRPPNIPRRAARLAARFPDSSARTRDLDRPLRIEYTIVEVVANPSEMQPADARQRNAPGVCANLRLNRNQRRCALQVLSNRVRRFGTIDPPPILGRADLRRCRDG